MDCKIQKGYENIGEQHPRSSIGTQYPRHLPRRVGGRFHAGKSVGLVQRFDCWGGEDQLEEPVAGPVHLMNALSFAYFYLGEFSLAKGVLERAVKLYPENPLIWNNLGAVHLALGDTSRAGKTLHAALARARKLTGDHTSYYQQLVSNNIHMQRRHSDGDTSELPLLEIFNCMVTEVSEMVVSTPPAQLTRQYQSLSADAAEAGVDASAVVESSKAVLSMERVDLSSKKTWMGGGALGNFKMSFMVPIEVVRLQAPALLVSETGTDGWRVKEKMASCDMFIKLMMLGDTGVGKTALVVKFVDDGFKNDNKPTFGIDFKHKMLWMGGKRVKIQIWDTAGQERHHTITKQYYRSAMGIFLCYDVTREDSFQNIKRWNEQIELHGAKDVQRILVGNKVDAEDIAVSPERGRALAEQYGMPFFEASAWFGDNVNE
ncbi:RABE1A, partial [Symbiodinium sp. KB8]